MSLDIQKREKEGITILDIGGRLTVGGNAERLREEIRGLISAKTCQVILNLKDVDYIDSTGLGTLVVCYTALQKAGGGLRLLNLNRRNIELLLLTKLATIFDLFGQEQDAVNSFFPDRAIRRFDILSFVQQQKLEDRE